MATYVRLGSDASAPGGYLAVPPRGGPSSGVLVAPAIAGLNDYIGRVADALADEGYLAFALDYYARTGGPPDLDTPEKIMAAVADVSDPRVLDDMSTVTSWLRDIPECDGRIGTVGFCLGGSYALLASARGEGIACAVSFYGLIRYRELTTNKPVSPLDAAARAECPLLGHFGENDHLVSAFDVADLRRVTAHLDAEVHTYPGAGHAFHEDFREQVYHPEAAATAWRRTTAFLHRHLPLEAIHFGAGR